MKLINSYLDSFSLECKNVFMEFVIKIDPDIVVPIQLELTSVNIESGKCIDNMSA